MNMIIYFSPQRSNATLVLEKQNNSLIINNVSYDFTQLPNGGTLLCEAIDCDYICDDVKNIDNVLHIHVILPHGPNPNNAIAFPEPILVENNGIITLPGGVNNE